MSQIHFELEWTDAASKKIERLLPKSGDQPEIALPPLECLPSEGDILFLGPKGRQQPFVVAERQYHHEGGPDWNIVLIIDVPDGD